MTRRPLASWWLTALARNLYRPLGRFCSSASPSASVLSSRVTVSTSSFCTVMLAPARPAINWPFLSTVAVYMSATLNSTWPWPLWVRLTWMFRLWAGTFSPTTRSLNSWMPSGVAAGGVKARSIERVCPTPSLPSPCLPMPAPERSVRLAGNARPCRRRTAIGPGQGKTQADGVLQAAVSDTHRFDLAGALRQSGFHEGGRADQIWPGFGQRVVHPHQAHRGGCVFVAGDRQNQAARGLGVVAGSKDPRQVQPLVLRQAHRARQLHADAGGYLAGGLARRIEAQAQVGGCGCGACLRRQRDAERVVFRDIEPQRRRPYRHTVDGEGFLLRAVGDGRVHGADLVQAGIGGRGREAVGEVAAAVGDDADDSLEDLLVQDQFQPRQRLRRLAGPVQRAARDDHVLLAIRTDGADVGDLSRIVGFLQ